MSFFSDLVSGNFGNLGHDLNPSNAFSDFGSDAMKVLSNPIADVGIAATLLTAGLAAPEFLAADAGAAAATDVAGVGAAGGLGGFDLGTIGPGVTDFGTAIGSDVLPEAATATAGAAPIDFSSVGMAPVGSNSPGFQAAADYTAFPGSTPGGFGAPGAITAGSASPFDASGTAAIPFTDASGGLTPAGTGVSPALSGAAGAASGAPGGGILSTIGGALKTASPLIGAAGLGYNLYQGYEQKKQMDALNAKENALAANAAATAAAANKTAQPMITSGNTLMSYLTTNTLPPQFQAAIDQSVAAAKARIVQGYASRGMSADPKQNSGLAQDLNSVDMQANSLKADIEGQLSTAGNQMVQTANQLISTGLNATQLSAEIPIQMAKLNATLNAQMSSAIANFAAAMNGGQRGGGQDITLRLPQNVLSPQGSLTLQ